MQLKCPLEAEKLLTLTISSSDPVPIPGTMEKVTNVES